jgi:hypothetical protein
VTDQQYALLGDGKVRHLTRGIDQFLEMRRAQKPNAEAPRPQKVQGLSGAERRNLEKELGRLERAIEKGKAELVSIQSQLAEADHSDFELLTRLTQKHAEVTKNVAENEDLWLETSTKLEG